MFIKTSWQQLVPIAASTHTVVQLNMPFVHIQTCRYIANTAKQVSLFVQAHEHKFFLFTVRLVPF